MAKLKNLLPVLLTPLSAAFRCTHCGDCCRGVSVDVDQSSFYAIGDALSRRPHPLSIRAAEAFEMSPTPTPRAYAKLRMTGDKCVFLETDNLCYLHKHFGAETKPIVCRAYPFRPVLRPDGIHAPAVMSCKAMREQLGQLALPTGPAEPGAYPPASLVGDGGRYPELTQIPFERHSPGAYLPLGKGRRARVEIIGKIEDRLAELLSQRSLPLSARLLGARYFIEELAAGGPGDKGPQVSAREIDPCYDRVVCGPGGDHGPLLERLAKVQPEVRKHLALLFDLLDGIEATRGADRPLCTRQASYFGLGMDITAEERDDLMVRLYGWRYTEVEVEFLPVVEAYLIERLRASHITSSHGLLATVHSLVIGAALLRFLTTGLAGLGRRVATQKDLMAAIKETDERFFHEPRILDRFGEGGLPLYLQVRTAEIFTVLPPAPAQVYDGPLAEAANETTNDTTNDRTGAQVGRTGEGGHKSPPVPTEEKRPPSGLSLG